MNKVLFLSFFILIGALSHAQEGERSRSLLLSPGDIRIPADNPFATGRGLPMEPEVYRALTGFTSNCGYGRVYRDGSCETDRWTRDGDSSEFVWNGGDEFEMRCQREQFDRDADRFGESGNIASRTIYREVVVRFRENAQENRDHARRRYIEIEEDGVPRRVEVGSTRNFRFEDCNISRGPQPRRPADQQCDSITSCLIRNADVELDGEQVRVNIQF